MYVWRGWGGGSSRRVGWQGPTILKRPTLPVEAKVNPLVNFIFILSMEGNVLFNDAFDTFYLRLYGVRHMVKDHSDSEKGNLLPPHRLLVPQT